MRYRQYRRLWCSTHKTGISQCFVALRVVCWTLNQKLCQRFLFLYDEPLWRSISGEGLLSLSADSLTWGVYIEATVRIGAEYRGNFSKQEPLLLSEVVH